MVTVNKLREPISTKDRLILNIDFADGYTPIPAVEDAQEPVVETTQMASVDFSLSDLLDPDTESTAFDSVPSTGIYEDAPDHGIVLVDRDHRRSYWKHDGAGYIQISRSQAYETLEAAKYFQSLITSKGKDGLENLENAIVLAEVHLPQLKDVAKTAFDIAYSKMPWKKFVEYEGDVGDYTAPKFTNYEPDPAPDFDPETDLVIPKRKSLAKRLFGL